MKALFAIILVAAMLMLAGCAGNNAGAPSALAPSAAAPAPSAIGPAGPVPVINNSNASPQPLPPQMANPASVNCVNNGGNLRIVKDASGGEVGMCDFANGTTCEEWAYFRGECPANASVNASAGANESGAPGAGSASAGQNSGGAANAGNATGGLGNGTAAVTQTPAAENQTGANATVAASAPRPTQEIQMIARQFSFTPSTITVKQGTHVVIRLNSNDVVHGFSLPDYGVNAVINPGTTTTVAFDADKVGTFTFRCSVVCGGGHAQMTGSLTVTP